MRSLLILVPILFFFASCDSLRIYEENQIIKGESWDAKDQKVFEMNMDDTLSPCNIFINIRHRGDYEFRNLFLFITTHRPDGKMSIDTVDCVLQDNEGKWLGTGIGDLYDNRLFFRSGVRFPVKGKYTFTFEQAMRKNPIEHITDVGFRVERMPQ